MAISPRLEPTIRTSNARAAVPPSQARIPAIEPMPSSAAALGERNREQEEAERRDRRPACLATRQAAVADSSGHVGEYAYSTGCDALDDRKGGERQGRRVEGKAARLHREAQQPAPVRDQEVQRLQRPTQRESREGCGGIVLTQVRETRKRGRDRRKNQPNGYAKTHADSNADSSWISTARGTLKVGSKGPSRAGIPLAAAAARRCRHLLPRVVFEAVDRARAEELLARERARVESELASLAREGPREADDRVEPGDEGSEDLYEDEAEEGRREELEDELAAIGRAEARLHAGTFGALRRERQANSRCPPRGAADGGADGRGAGTPARRLTGTTRSDLSKAQIRKREIRSPLARAGGARASLAIASVSRGCLRSQARNRRQTAEPGSRSPFVRSARPDRRLTAAPGSIAPGGSGGPSRRPGDERPRPVSGL